MNAIPALPASSRAWSARLSIGLLLIPLFHGSPASATPGIEILSTEGRVSNFATVDVSGRCPINATASTNGPQVRPFATNVPVAWNPNAPAYSFLFEEITSAGGGVRCECPGNWNWTYSTIGTAWSWNRVAVRGGLGGSGMEIDWNNNQYARAKNDGMPFLARADSDFRAEIDFEITGFLPGTPVEVYYRYSFSNNWNEQHEAVGEDPNRSYLRNLELRVPGGTFWDLWPNSPGDTGLMEDSGSITMTAGEIYTFVFSADGISQVLAPGRPNPPAWRMFCETEIWNDVSGAFTSGTLTLSLVPLPPPPQPPPPVILYSLDIGSAQEASLGGTFDPGDLYPQRFFQGQNASLYRNDASLFNGTDPWPTPSNSASFAPVADGDDPSDVRGQFFNINGTAFLPFDLAQYMETAGITAGPIGWSQLYLAFPDVLSCVDSPLYVLVSFDDDGLAPFTADPQNGPGGAPFNSSSPDFGEPFGQELRRDEVLQLRLLLGGSGVPPTVVEERQFSESVLDPDLMPDPAPNDSTNNNDINALAVLGGERPSSCGDFWYFTVDSEAHYGLDPGTIYVQGSSGSFRPAILPSHLGLPRGVDINAFDFAWVTGAEEGEIRLGVIFSVAMNKPHFPENESAGLLPGMIYVSALDGTHRPFLDAPLDGDIDALAVFRQPFVSPPLIFTENLPDGYVGSYYSVQLEASGGMAGLFNWSLAGSSLPAGLNLDPQSGTITGTPTAVGDYTVTIEVESGTAGSNARTYMLTIQPSAAPPSITTQFLSPGFVGAIFQGEIETSGGATPLRFDVTSGALPPGLTLNVLNGRINGVPTEEGTFDFTIETEDNLGRTDSRALDLEVFSAPPEAPVITTAALPNGRVGDPYNFSLNATGGSEPYTWGWMSGLPDGLDLASDGTITGTPTAAQQVASIQVFVFDTNFQQNVAILHMGILPATSQGATPPLFTLPVGPFHLDRDDPWSHTLGVSGGEPPLSFSLMAGSLPTGLTLNGLTGTISGVPTQNGDQRVAIVVEDALGDFDTVSVDIHVRDPGPQGYPAWKAFHDVLSDGVSQDGDNYPPMGEYYFGLDPNSWDAPGYWGIEPVSGYGPDYWRVRVPSRGVPDVGVEREIFDFSNHTWNRLSTDLFVPGNKTMVRLRFYEK